MIEIEDFPETWDEVDTTKPWISERITPREVAEAAAEHDTAFRAARSVRTSREQFKNACWALGIEKFHVGGWPTR